MQGDHPCLLADRINSRIAATAVTTAKKRKNVETSADYSGSEDDDEPAKNVRKSDSALPTVTRQSARPSRAAASESKSKTKLMITDEVDFNENPERLYTSQVHR